MTEILGCLTGKAGYKNTFKTDKYKIQLNKT